jgi:hypothetical protein
MMADAVQDDDDKGIMDGDRIMNEFVYAYL